MRVVTLILLAFCFGLSYWECALLVQLRKEPCSLHYSRDVPRVFRTSVFQILKLLGSVGLIVVPALYWGNGFLAVGAALAVFLVLGAIFGIVILTLICRL